MTTFVWRDGVLTEKSKAPPPSGAFSYMPDIAPFVTMEGRPIGGRKQLRDYERAHGVRQVGTDMRGPHQR